jgi:AcrR family transcriptional regulator
MEYNEKQLAILNSAEKLFSVMGFDGSSVRDIAQDAGVNVAMISYYFGSKEKLMEAVFEHKTYKMRLKVENLVADKTKTCTEKVYILLSDYIDKFLDQPQFHKIMLREQLSSKPGGVCDMVLELKKRNLQSIKKLIQDGQKNGEFKKNIDVPLMMATMVGTVSQVVIGGRFFKEVNGLTHLSDEEFTNYVRKKLNVYLKKLFKSIIVNEQV